MPLVMLFGKPGQGKKRLTDELTALCRGAGLEVVEVSAQSLGFQGWDVIKHQSELNKRLFQSTQQYLSPSCVVILNYTNHLKSLRYELFCLARERRTPSCVLTCFRQDDVPPADMDPALYADICSRFEKLLDSESDSPQFSDAASVLTYIQSPQRRETKKSTAQSISKHIPVFQLIGAAAQRLLQQQQTLGAVANVQIFEDVYYTTPRLIGIRELQDAVAEFKGTCDHSADNATQANAFRGFLEARFGKKL